MLFRNLGKTKIKVSEISFGTVSLGVPYGINTKDESDLLPESEAIKLLKEAFAKGINFFDTARAYGRSEELIGRAFGDIRSKKHHIEAISRPRTNVAHSCNVIISTKPIHLKNKNGVLPDGKQIKALIHSSLDTSLSNLQSDYIDVYMLHDSDISVFTNKSVIETLIEIKNSGKVKTLGVSTYTVEQTRKAIETGIYDVIQLPYNLMDQRQREMFPLAYQKGIGIVVRSALFKGILTEKGNKLHPKLSAVQEHRRVYERLLSEKAPTLAQLAIKFILSHKEISSVLIGIDKSEYLQEAIQVIDGNYLDEATLAEAYKLAYPEPDFLDLPKWSQKGWLK